MMKCNVAFRSLWSLLAVCIIGLFADGADAQIFNFHHYHADDGLPQVQVFAIEQDVEGYLWVGTYSGLGRYNGRDFDNYSRLDGLGANVVSALVVDGNGKLWVGTGSGLCRYVADTDGFDCLRGEGLEAAPVNVLLAEEGDVLWAGTDRGLYRVEGERVTRLKGAEALENGVIQSLARDDAGGLWIGTSEGLLHRMPGSRRFENVALPGAAGTSVTALYADAGSVLIGTASGLFRFRHGHVTPMSDLPPEWAGADISAIARDRTGALWVTSGQGVLHGGQGDYRLLGRENGLDNEITHTVFIDREGMVWLGHDDGLSKWVPGPFSGYRTEHGLIDNFVRTIAEDAAGRLWLGTRSGVQIVRRVEGAWDIAGSERLTVADGLPDNRVYSIDFPAANEALLATYGGLARWRADEGIVDVLTEADGLPTSSTQAVLVDHAGGVWIGTNLGTVFLDGGSIRPVGDPELAQAYAYRIREDTSGRVWFATRDHGLFILADGEFSRLDGEHGLTNETLWDLAPSSGQGMWVGSNGDGLFRVFPDGRIEQYTEADGLVDNFVWQVLEDSRGNVWAYTNHGLSRFDGRHFRNFGRNEGLLHPEGGATGAWETEDGQLWFASADGLMRYDPDHEVPERQAPPIVIERVIHEGETLTRGVTLPPDAGNVDVEFAALSFWNEQSLEYRYRLLGADDNWSDSLAYRPVTFGNLSGGEYVFEVQARHPDGPWTREPARFSFSVQPPFWTTVWFWVLVALAVGLLVWVLVQWRLKAAQTRQRELEGLVTERTRELEAVNRKLEAASITDPLTGLHNRRFLVNQIHADVAQARRAYVGSEVFPNRDIVFMMVDLDNFKEINDTYGHLAGDQVLRGYSKILRQQLRTSDYVVRWGGEEFLVVARQTEASRLNIIAERMLAEARQAVFVVDGVEAGLKCNCSIGVSHFPFVSGEPDALNWEQIVDVADRAIYLAKELGRDGWVAIHGTDQARVEDAQAFLQRVKADVAGVLSAGEIMIESNFPDPFGIDGECWIQR